MRKKTNKKFKPIDFSTSTTSSEVLKQGRVIEAMPNAHFKIKYKDETIGVGYLAGKMKVFKIRVLVGDMVEVVVDLRGGKGRIVKRL